ncbi:hypothetical protein MPC1_2250002 [Methylocella tundrae]|nr:hypothetical protein MPC1_2250002 [Methylocella tundrae]
MLDRRANENLCFGGFRSHENIIAEPQAYRIRCGGRHVQTLRPGVMGGRARIHREGEVVHLVAQRITDLSADLARVGSRDMAFPLPHGRGDQVGNGGSEPNPRELPPKGLRTRDIYISALNLDTIQGEDTKFPLIRSGGAPSTWPPWSK